MDSTKLKTSTGNSRRELTDLIDTQPHPVNNEQQKMIADAACFRALGRDFDGGDPLVDWLEAEKEITGRTETT
jgi:hypothetical protein